MITAKQLSEAYISGANNIENNRQKVDALNVFPVPDGDTGTNMSMTMGAAREDLLHNDYPTVGDVAGKAASALLRGARGNSGVITSLLFRGFSKGLKHKSEAGAADLVEALEIGVAAAYKAVMKPTEGTILTVARVAAEKSRAALTDTMEPLEIWDLIIQYAEEALAQTPEQLPVLKKAGVVDAGGQGLVYILKGMRQVFAGEGVVPGIAGDTAAAPAEEAATVVNAAGEVEEVDINNPYCTEFLVMRDDPKHDPAGLRAYLESIGDCVVVVDDDEIIKCHVHTAHPGLALEKAGTYGMLTKLKIENMIEQHKAQVASVKEQQKAAAPAAAEIDPALTAGFVAVAAGDGVQQLFRDLGVQQIVSGGQTMNPSTEDILHAAEQVPAMDVYVLPNNKNIVMAAEQAARLARTSGVRRIHVVPTTTIPQGISAMMAYDESAEIKDNVEAMQEAASRVQSGSVTFAARDSDYDGHQIKEGELLALTPADFDFENSTLTINKSYQRLKGKDVITSPKTVKSNRTIKMPDFLCDEMRDLVSSLYDCKPTDRLFPVTKHFLKHEMERGCKDAGVKRIRIHDIRHSAISLLIEMGFSAVAIAERVGHESIDITYRYAHMFPSTQTEMADKLNNIRKESEENVG